MMQIPPDLKYEVDQKHWGKSFDPANPEHQTEEIVNGYITCMLACYRTIYRNRENEDLWQIFHEDFEGFTFDIFRLGHRIVVRELREQLVIQGVWVRGPRGSISYAKTLQDCLDETTPADWTEEAIKERHKLIQSTTSNSITQLPQNSSSPARQTRQPYQPYTQFPIPERGDRGSTQAKLLTDLMKIYNNDDKKYGGEEYDILDVKLQVFYDCCSKIGLSDTQYYSAFSIMLKGRASNFYYDKLSGRSYDFQTMINLTRAHFETEENHQKYLSEWRETTLLRTISENPDKSRLECFQLTVDKLQKVQRGLTKEYQYEHNLRDQVINACRGVEECNLALYKPSPTFEGICAELRSAIGTAMRSREAKSTFTTQLDVDDDKYEYGQHWTDRTYGGRGRGRGRSFGSYNRGRGGNTHRGTQRYGGNQRTGFQQKRCHVCDKPGCWSTKHRWRSKGTYEQELMEINYFFAVFAQKKTASVVLCCMECSL